MSSHKPPKRVTAVLVHATDHNRQPQPVRHEREIAASAAHDYLRRTGEVHADDLAHVAADGVNVYLTGHDNPASLWERCIEPALLELATVERDGEVYRYRTEP